ncbi:bifunctional 4-hydroxy-2-oxoglutarate aldolase/2-dehydro-3-deoxy-phosphogluconate aldolase [Rubritalea tangerina]|uniref:2-dehydro-3-deoxy-phosphogluconate aldolase n=2 Tax=Rubritalea tangerina TaxID=430798 RepID=A0ABW4ZFJ1_9BACT
MISSLRVVPVVVVDEVELAQSLGEALVAGGLPIAEVTFRTDAAMGAMEVLASRGDILVGAGTVTTVDQVKEARESGAKFVVSPGFHREVVEYCLANEMLVLPGVSSASDIALAMEYGLKNVKFFPAEASGGVGLLKALSAPYQSVKFVPTGGIHAGNVRDYLSLDSVLACGGSWMVERSLVNDGKFEEIAKLTREVVELVK